MRVVGGARESGPNFVCRPVRCVRPAPVLGSRVNVHGTHLPRTSDEVMERLCDRHGSFELKGLDPDSTYELRLTLPVERSDLGSVRLSSWKPRSEVVRVPRAYVVSGTVRDLGGRSITRARIRHVDRDLPTRVALSADDGEFRLAGLPYGPAFLSIEADDSRGEPASARLVATPESPRIDVVLRTPSSADEVARAVSNATPGRRAVLFHRDPSEPPSELRVSDDGTLHLGSGGDAYDGALWFPSLGAESDLTPCVDFPGYAAPGAPWTLRPSGSLRIRIDEPDSASPWTIRATWNGGPEFKGRKVERGVYVMSGLAPGRWSVVATSRTPRTRRQSVVEVRSGQVIEIDLPVESR